MGWLFGFSEKRIKKKLEKLHNAVERNHKKADSFGSLLAKYLADIEKNSDAVKNKKEMNALVQAVQLAISKAKEENAKMIQSS